MRKTGRGEDLQYFGLSVEKSTRLKIEQFAKGLVGLALPAPAEAEEPKPAKKCQARAAA